MVMSMAAGVKTKPGRVEIGSVSDGPIRRTWTEYGWSAVPAGVEFGDDQHRGLPHDGRGDDRRDQPGAGGRRAGPC